MNTAIAIIALMFTGGCLSAQFTPEDTVDHDKLEQDADVVIHWYPDDSRPMQISIGPRKDNEPAKVVRVEKFSTTSESLKNFFNARPRKDLIVIVYRKNVLSEPKRNIVSIRLRDYFVARGYKKIFIGQANNGGPPHPVLEHPKNKTAEQVMTPNGP